MCVMCSTSVPTLFQYFFYITSLHSFTFFMKCFLLLVGIIIELIIMCRYNYYSYVSMCTSICPRFRISFFVCSTFVNLISDDESDWEKDPDVQKILHPSAGDSKKMRYDTCACSVVILPLSCCHAVV